MPRYFFHARDDFGVARDCEGAEFNTLDAARAEARASACDIAAEQLRTRNVSNQQILEIADETGLVLETLAVVTILK